MSSQCVGRSELGSACSQTDVAVAGAERQQQAARSDECLRLSFSFLLLPPEQSVPLPCTHYILPRTSYCCPASPHTLVISRTSLAQLWDRFYNIHRHYTFTTGLSLLFVSYTSWHYLPKLLESHYNSQSFLAVHDLLMTFQRTHHNSYQIQAFSICVHLPVHVVPGRLYH